MIGHSSGTLFELPIHSGLRLGVALIITLMVISSPIFMIVNPAFASSSFSNDRNTSAPSTISQDGSDFTTQADLGSVTARPTNNIVNTKSFYDIVFVTALSGTIKKIQVVFQAGTTVPPSDVFIEAEGIGPGSVSTSGQVITYTVNNAVNIPAGTKIRLEFSNIGNPPTPSVNYKVTVLTRNAANVAIDGPTQSAPYIIKQINGIDIAKNAVTPSKIADGSITSPKVADGAITTEKIADGAIMPEAIERVGAVAPAFAGVVTASFAECLPGEEAVGGGFELFGIIQELTVISETKLGFEAWEVGVFNSDSNDHSFQVRVICMPAMP